MEAQCLYTIEPMHLRRLFFFQSSVPTPVIFCSMRKSGKLLNAFLITCFSATVTVTAYGQLYTPQLKQHKVQTSSVPPKAYAFHPSDVSIAGQTPFTRAAEVNTGYLLWLQPTKLLARFYHNAGLPFTDSAYGGWESSGLAGHTLGHYLSACAWAYASTGDKHFKERIDHTVHELAKCQDAR